MTHNTLHRLDEDASLGHERGERLAQAVRRDALERAGIVAVADRLTGEAGRESLAVWLSHDQTGRLAPPLEVFAQPGRHRPRLGLPACRDSGRVGLPGPVDSLPARGDGLALAQAEAEHQAHRCADPWRVAGGLVDRCEPCARGGQRQDRPRPLLHLEHGNVPGHRRQHAMLDRPHGQQLEDPPLVIRAGRLVVHQVIIARQLDAQRGDCVDGLVAQVEHVQAVEQFDASQMRRLATGRCTLTQASASASSARVSSGWPPLARNAAVSYPRWANCSAARRHVNSALADAPSDQLRTQAPAAAAVDHALSPPLGAL